MADKKELYKKEDFCIVFDRSRNLHFIEARESSEKTTPAQLEDSSFTRREFAQIAIDSFVNLQKRA